MAGARPARGCLVQELQRAILRFDGPGAHQARGLLRNSVQDTTVSMAREKRGVAQLSRQADQFEFARPPGENSGMDSAKIVMGICTGSRSFRKLLT